MSLKELPLWQVERLLSRSRQFTEMSNDLITSLNTEVYAFTKKCKFNYIKTSKHNPKYSLKYDIQWKHLLEQGSNSICRYPCFLSNRTNITWFGNTSPHSFEPSISIQHALVGPFPLQWIPDAIYQGCLQPHWTPDSITIICWLLKTLAKNCKINCRALGW